MPATGPADDRKQEDVVVNRSLRGVEARVDELLARRELAYSFSAIETKIVVNGYFESPVGPPH